MGVGGIYRKDRFGEEACEGVEPGGEYAFPEVNTGAEDGGLGDELVWVVGGLTGI